MQEMHKKHSIKAFEYKLGQEQKLCCVIQVCFQALTREMIPLNNLRPKLESVLDISEWGLEAKL